MKLNEPLTEVQKRTILNTLQDLCLGVDDAIEIAYNTMLKNQEKFEKLNLIDSFLIRFDDYENISEKMVRMYTDIYQNIDRVSRTDLCDNSLKMLKLNEFFREDIVLFLQTLEKGEISDASPNTVLN